MFDFRRTTLFCLEKRLSKHKMTIFSKNLGGMAPIALPLATPMITSVENHIDARIKVRRFEDGVTARSSLIEVDVLRREHLFSSTCFSCWANLQCVHARRNVLGYRWFDKCITHATKHMLLFAPVQAVVNKISKSTLDRLVYNKLL